RSGRGTQGGSLSAARGRALPAETSGGNKRRSAMCRRSGAQCEGLRPLPVKRRRCLNFPFSFSKPRPELAFSENHKIITMHNFNSLQLAGADLRGLEGADSARELSAVQVADPDDLPGLKLAFAAGDARRQEALAALAQRFLCAAIHEQRAFGMMEECDPALSPP